MFVNKYFMFLFSYYSLHSHDLAFKAYGQCIKIPKMIASDVIYRVGSATCFFCDHLLYTKSPLLKSYLFFLLTLAFLN